MNFDIANESKKLGLLRILTGIIIFIRFIEIFFTQVNLNGYDNLSVFILLFLIVLFSFTIGFVTPIANLLVIILIPIVDAKMMTNTLGSTIAINLLLVLFLLNSGLNYSVDKLLVSKKILLSKLINKSYLVVGLPNVQNIRRAYFLGFVLYAVSSFFALQLHFQDFYWVEGLTIKSMLSNSFLCKGADFFRNLEMQFPLLIDYISISGGIFQTLFQIFMVPLIFFKYGKSYVKVWGFIFFLISLLLLSLSYLPHLELILWTIIFCPLIAPIDKIKILYDDKCNLCRKALTILKCLNFNKIYEFLPITGNDELYKGYNLTEDEVKMFMVGFYNGNVYKGYNLYMKIIQKNPILVILYPIFWIGKVLKIGPYIYNLIALKRYKLLGQCKYSYKISSNNLESKITKNETVIQKLIYIFYTISIFLFIIFNSSFINIICSNEQENMSLKDKYNLYSKRIGIEAPEVFNYIDLSMGDNFMTIKKIQNNKWKIIPIVGSKGERLNYLNYDLMLFSNHNSDKLYFGQTLIYRRLLIDEINNVITFHEQGFGKDHIEFLIKNDYLKTNEKTNVTYKVEVFKSNSSKVKRFEYDKNRHNLKKVYENILTYNGKNYLE